MTSKEAREEIRARATEYLRPDSTGKGYICPICGSGSGKHGTGITSRDGGQHFTCWAGCYTNADIIDIIGLEHGIALDDAARYPEKLQAAADAFNIRIEGEPKPAQNRTEKRPEAAGFSRFFQEAEKHIAETDYPQRRGLSPETMRHFHIGYMPAWTHPKAPNAPPSPRLIIPTSGGSYLARDTRSEIPEEQKQYSKSKAGETNLFNASALRTAGKPIFITEGEIDAMSIYELHGEAVALGSVNMYRKLIEAAKEQKPAQPLIIALDNDAAGEKTAAELLEGLRAAGIPSYRFNVYGSCKDANEALVNEREKFAQRIAEVYSHAADLDGYERELKGREYRQRNSAAAHLQEFIDGIADSVNTPATSTGFRKLDAALDGGLYSGLYTLGAISSLGKTSLMLQIADNIAQSGKDVLIISLEMARSELMAKSISRNTIIDVLENGGETSNAKTTRGILSGKRYEKYSQTERDLINRSIRKYGSYADHLYIIEGLGNIGVKEVREYVEAHREATGNTPVLIIDYLQILSPADVRATDKQNTDKAVLELKRLSRDFNTPVIAISSLNRDNYSNRINTAAFKESGSIEYSADCLIGLQYTGAGEKSFDAEKAAKANPREIELVILKQRNGAIGSIVPLEYYPMFNYFAEA